MTVKDRIEAILAQALQPSSLEVLDESHLHAGHGGSRPNGETHFRVKVTAEVFADKSLVARHRVINGLLSSELQPGGVHALAIEARAPGEPMR